MKYLKLFESFTSKSKEFLDICWKLANIGDILPESDIYQYVQEIHHTDSDFWDGDLGYRIEEYTSYKLKEISISKIDLDEWDFDEDDVESQQQMYQETGDYPPIVVSSLYMGRYTIIDGTHRANALNNLGLQKIKAWVGQ